MSDQLPVPAASNTFERIKRVNESGAEFWSARELARVLEYTDFRNFIAVIAEPFMNWAARCPKICRWQKASRKSKAGKRNDSKRSKRNL